MDEARKLAVKDAQHKAQIYAGAAAINLGNIISVSENGGSMNYGDSAFN